MLPRQKHRHAFLNLALIVALLLSSFATFAVAPTPVFADHTPAPNGVAVVGSLQSELGCPGDWQPECAATDMTHDAGDDVWQFTGDVPGGDWEYKVALNDSWDENYGAGAAFNGPNIALNLAVTTTVKFYYDHKSHWVADNQTSVIATVPGNFQSEIGCGGDWDPSCLRSWLQDPDGDGTYSFTTGDIPPGDYEGKVAINESWDENYGVGGVAGGDNYQFSVAAGEAVEFSYDSASHILTITVIPPAIDVTAIVTDPVRHPVTEQIFYFVMPDRFDNGDASNDLGGLAGDRSVTGFDPTDKGYFHGGDMAGLLGKLDYLEEMGIESIWMTPMFKNRPVQGSGGDASAGYHGYWTVDFTQFDPHFGTNAELEQLIAEAHNRGMKIFFDIVVNHTADIIQYEEGQYNYRNKTEYPYRDSEGTPFDDRDYINDPNFPELDPATSFPYTPEVDPADANGKAPAWLNDARYYHNRGNSTFSGENSLYGDFFGLDDLFTEHPDVVEGMVDIFKDWISNYDIDGFRLDTVKHVNMEFWQRFGPEILAHAESVGRPDFFLFGEVYSGNEQFLSFFTTKARLPSVLDFGFQEAVRAYAAGNGSSDNLAAFFDKDDWYTDANSNAYSLMNFAGNHDMGRIGFFIKNDNGGTLPADALERTNLAHAMLYFARGVPIVYYGDEQGFVGDGGDKDARQDMMPSQVASYNDDDLIGTDATTADANFDQNHPTYTALQEYAAIFEAHQGLRTGAQISPARSQLVVHRGAARRAVHD